MMLKWILLNRHRITLIASRTRTLPKLFKLYLLLIDDRFIMLFPISLLRQLRLKRRDLGLPLIGALPEELLHDAGALPLLNK